MSIYNPIAGGITQLTGDVTAGPGSGSQVATLASIISAGGPTGSATVAPIITYDAKGRLTAVSSATITPAVGSITGLGTGVATFLATPSSANLISAVTDETGSGSLVFGTGPTITLASASTAVTQSQSDNSTKIATTAYVDEAVLGQRYKEAVKYGSVAVLPSIVYANGSSGVGATLTGVALAAISLDGASPGVGDRVLIKNQVSDFQNGIYVVTQTGSGIAVFILTRASDFDQSSEIQTGDSIFITAGSTLANTLWAYTGIDSPTMGTTSLPFAQVSADLIVGQSVILSGTTTRVLYDNAGVLGEYTISGSGNVAMTTSPTFVTPVLGVATATSLAIGGATIGSNGLAVTGHLLVEGVTSTGATGTGKLVFDTTPQFASRIGIGVAAGSQDLITASGSQATTQYIKATNTNASGTGGFLAVNDSGNTAEFGMRGSTRTTYGALVASDAYFYGNSALTVMVDSGTGTIKFAAGGSTEQMRLDGATGNLGIATTNPSSFKLQVAGSIGPNANKSTDLGSTSLRWNNIYYVSATTGTSRLAPAKTICPDCGKPMQRGTGTTITLGEDEDYISVWCQDCGVRTTEAINHLPKEKLAERLPAPKIEFLGLKVNQYSGHSRGIQVLFNYGEKENSTYLSDVEYKNFKGMSVKEQKAFIQELGQREWDALEEIRLMDEVCTQEQAELDEINKVLYD